MNNKYSNQL